MSNQSSLPGATKESPKETGVAILPCQRGTIVAYVRCLGDRDAYREVFPKIAVTVTCEGKTIATKPMTEGGWVQFDVEIEKAYVVTAKLDVEAYKSHVWENATSSSDAPPTNASLVGAQTASVYFDLQPLPKPRLRIVSRVDGAPKLDPIDIVLTKDSVECHFVGALVGAETDATKVVKKVRGGLFQAFLANTPYRPLVMPGLLFGVTAFTPPPMQLVPTRLLAGDYDVKLTKGGDRYILVTTTAQALPDDVIEVRLIRLMRPRVRVTSLLGRPVKGIDVTLTSKVAPDEYDYDLNPTDNQGLAVPTALCRPGTYALRGAMYQEEIPLFFPGNTAEGNVPDFHRAIPGSSITDRDYFSFDEDFELECDAEVRFPPRLRAIEYARSSRPATPYQARLLVTVSFVAGAKGNIKKPRKKTNVKVSLTCDGVPFEVVGTTDGKGQIAFELLGCDDPVVAVIESEWHTGKAKIEFGTDTPYEIVHSCCNEVEFLLDGSQFFGRLKASLEKLASAKPTKNTYLRMTYWAIDPHIVIDGTSLAALLKAVAVNHPVEVILWKPATTVVSFTQWKMPDFWMNENEAHVVAFRKEFNGVKNVRFFEEKHPVNYTGSMHQKLTVFSFDGQLEALVGGINLEKQYLGDHEDGPGGLHDTAIALTGPAALEVETAFLDRWKVLDPGSDRLKVHGVTRKQKLADPKKGANAETLTTEVSASGTKAAIQERMLELVQGAQSYIYVENFTFWDPKVVSAVCTRLKEPANPLRVCILMPHMNADPAAFNAYLSRLAYVKMGFCSAQADPNCTGFTIAGWNDPATNPKEWSLVELGLSSSNGWMQQDYLRGPKGEKVKLIDVREFTYKEGCFPKVRFFQPWKDNGAVYLHSKLVLVDNIHMLIGSANFNLRSMVYDWELNVHAAGNKEVVIAALQKLFPHYGIYALKPVPDALDEDSKHWAHEIPGGKLGLIWNTPEGLLAKLEDLEASLRNRGSYDYV